jgi:hypothetical protein
MEFRVSKETLNLIYFVSILIYIWIWFAFEPVRIFGEKIIMR